MVGSDYYEADEERENGCDASLRVSDNMKRRNERTYAKMLWLLSIKVREQASWLCLHIYPFTDGNSTFLTSGANAINNKA